MTALRAVTLFFVLQLQEHFLLAFFILSLLLLGYNTDEAFQFFISAYLYISHKAGDMSITFLRDRQKFFHAAEKREDREEGSGLRERPSVIALKGDQWALLAKNNESKKIALLVFFNYTGDR